MKNGRRVAVNAAYLAKLVRERNVLKAVAARARVEQKRLFLLVMQHERTLARIRGYLESLS